MPVVIPGLRRLRQKEGKFKVSLDYRVNIRTCRATYTVKPFLKTITTKHVPNPSQAQNNSISVRV